MKKNYLLLIIAFYFVLCLNAQAQDTTIKQRNATATNLGLFGSYTWDIAVDPTDNNYIYLASYYSPNGFFRSADNGQTWQALPKNADYGAGRAVEVNPNNGNVYALLDSLLISTDHGQTYKEYSLGTDLWSLLYAQNKLFISDANGDVHISSDEGENFTEVEICSDQAIWSLASSSDALYALCYDYNSETSSLYTSIDGGTTWSDLNIISQGVSGAELVAVNPATEHVFLIPSSLGGNTYISNDSGNTWTALSQTPISGHIAFNSAGRVYIGWYYSDDEGLNWTEFGTGGDYNHLMLPDPTDDSILYDTSVPGFLKSTDHGTTWTASVENITAVDVTGISQSIDKNVVWVATQNGPAKTENFLDENPDWQYMPTSENYMSSGYDAVWVKPDDTNFVVASSSQALQYSQDAGITWNTATVDIALTGAVFQITNDADYNLYAVVGPNVSTGSPTGGVIKSTDYGATWASLDFPNGSAARSIDVASDGDIFVGAHSSLGGMYKYNGTNWTKLDAPYEYEYISVLADPENTDIIYALASKGGVYKSSNDGVSWQAMNTGLGDIEKEFEEFNTLAIQTTSEPDSLYLSGVTDTFSKGVIYKSSDGAENWHLLYNGKKGETFNVLLFDGLVAGNSRGIYDLKSRANLAIKQTGNVIKISLKDAATKRKLKHKIIKIYKKKDNHWKFWRKVKTNNLGIVLLANNFTKNTKLKAVWKPKGNFINEYIKATKTKKIKL